MGSLSHTKSGCSFRTAGQHIKHKQPTRKEMGYCRIEDVKTVLGNGRVFPPSLCPVPLKPTAFTGRFDLEEARVPIETNYVEKMRGLPHRHLHLFCIPSLSVAEIAEAMPDRFLDLSGLSPKLLSASAGVSEKSWRWFLVSRLAHNTSPSGDLCLADFVYINTLFRNVTGENFFAGARTGCRTGLGSNSLIHHNEDGRIAIPKWEGLGSRTFYAYGLVLTK